MAFTGDGQYGTPWEFNTTDGGFDVAVINVNSYGRTNDTGAKRVTWIHELVKSEGTKPIDVFYALHGKGRVGLDLTLGDFSSDGERAIQLKSGQRIYFDASANAAPGTRARGFWGNVQGDSYMTHGTDGSGEFVDIYCAGVRGWRQRAASVNTSLQINVSNNVNVGAGFTMGVSTTGKLALDGIGGGTYLHYDGSTVRLYKGGAVVASW